MSRRVKAASGIHKYIPRHVSLVNMAHLSSYLPFSQRRKGESASPAHTNLHPVPCQPSTWPQTYFLCVQPLTLKRLSPSFFSTKSIVDLKMSKEPLAIQLECSFLSLLSFSRLCTLFRESWLLSILLQPRQNKQVEINICSESLLSKMMP